MEPIQPRGVATPPAAAKPAATKQTSRVATVAANLNEALSSPRRGTGFNKPAAASTRQAQPGDTVARFARADRTIHENFVNLQEQLDVRIHGQRTIRTVDEAIAESLKDPAAQEALAKEKAEIEALAKRLDEEERAQAAPINRDGHSNDEDLELARRLDAEERAKVNQLPVIEASPARAAEEALKALEEADAGVNDQQAADDELALAEAIRLSLIVEERPRPAAAEAPAIHKIQSQEEAELAYAIAESLEVQKVAQPADADGFVLIAGGELPKAEMQKLAEQTISASTPNGNTEQDGNCVIS